MGISYNTSVVRDGLVLHLDAANKKSYPGSGTIWKDLSGKGNNATLYNNTQFSQNDRGCMIFDGLDDYVLFNSPGTYLEYTFSFFCKWISPTTSNSRVFGISGYGTYTILRPENVGYHYNQAAGLTTTLSSNVNVGINKWCHITVSESRSASLAKIYINGVFRGFSSLISTSGFYGTVSLGAQWKSVSDAFFGNCNVSNFVLYNRVLSDTEIRQNFEATRGRYGI